MNERLLRPGVRLPAPPSLIAIDVDGTLLTGDHEVRAVTAAQVRRVRAAGTAVLLASARIAATLPAGLAAQVSNPTYLEVTAAGVDKASAVQRYCAERGIAPSAVVAVGDGPNDLGLFAYAGTSVAPLSAAPRWPRRRPG